MTPVEICRRVLDLPQAPVPGLALIQEFQGQAFTEIHPDQLADLIARQDQIDEAVNQLAEYAEHAKGIVKRCLQLQPQPSQRTPAGF